MVSMVRVTGDGDGDADDDDDDDDGEDLVCRPEIEQGEKSSRYSTAVGHPHLWGKHLSII